MDMTATPLHVWTVKATVADEYHSYIILSFINYTMVLSIGEVVAEVWRTFGFEVSLSFAYEVLSRVGDRFRFPGHN